MADISLGWQIIVDSPARAFGFQTTPPLTRGVNMGDLGAQSGYTLAGLRALPDAECLILSPQALWRDMALAGFTFGAGGAADWALVRSSETGRNAVLMANAQPGTTGQPNPWDASTVNAVEASQSFYVRLHRGQVSAGAGVTAGPGNDYAVFVVGDEAGDADGNPPFRLIFQRGRAAYLQQAAQDDAGDYSWPDYGENGVAGVNAPDSNTLWDATRTLQVEWLVVPDQNVLIVTLGDGAETLVLRQPASAPDTSGDFGAGGVAFRDGPPLAVAAGPLRFYGAGGTAGFEYGDMTFATGGTLTSPTIPLDFAYQGNGYVTASGSPLDAGQAVGGTVSPEGYSGVLVTYQLSVSGTDAGTAAGGAALGYADHTPIVTDVRLVIPPTFDYAATVGVPTDISTRVSEIDERAWVEWLAVDANSSTPVLRRQAGLRFDNADFSFTAGGAHRAVQYSRWLTVRSPVTGLMEDYTAPVLFLTGWAGQKTSVYQADPTRLFDCVLEDGSYPLRRVEVGYADPVDGWCPLAAQRFLALLSGRDDSFITDDWKTCDFGPDPPDCPHVKLPLGTGVSPRMAFAANRRFWDAGAEIASFDHSLLYTTPANILGSVPYAQAVAQAPFRGGFGVQESGDPANSDFLSSLWGARVVEVDTEDRRTGVAFYGQDPARPREAQGTFLAADDFLGAGWTAEVQGFRQALTAVSTLFVDPAFTAQYALAALSRVLLPNLAVRAQAAFLPGLYPMDAVTLDAGADGTAALIVEDVRQRFQVMDPRAFGCSLTGRWFPNATGSS